MKTIMIIIFALVPSFLFGLETTKISSKWTKTNTIACASIIGLGTLLYLYPNQTYYWLKIGAIPIVLYSLYNKLFNYNGDYNIYLLNDSNILKNSDSNTVTLFSHGIADTYKQANCYLEASMCISPLISFNYPDATESLIRVDFRKTSFGQTNEINMLRKAYNRTITWAQKKYGSSNNSLILYGLSRGASNLIIFAGTHTLPEVKAMILESPYYSMNDVIAHIIQKCKMTWISQSQGESIAEKLFWQYNRNGIKPCDVIKNIPKDLAILIICSEEDYLVPLASSKKLYDKFIETGHYNTHLFIANSGKHAKILQGNDREKYISALHSFYKKYNLPINTSIA